MFLFQEIVRILKHNVAHKRRVLVLDIILNIVYPNIEFTRSFAKNMNEFLAKSGSLDGSQ